jgi:hypothetical protein
MGTIRGRGLISEDAREKPSRTCRQAWFAWIVVFIALAGTAGGFSPRPAVASSGAPAQPFTEDGSGCPPNRADTGYTTHFNGWSAYLGPFTTFGGASTYTNTYSPYVAASSTSVSAWSMVGDGGGDYSQVGWLEHPGSVNGSQRWFFVQSKGPGIGDNSDAVTLLLTFSPYTHPALGSWHTYTSLYQDTWGGAVPSNALSWSIDGSLVVDANGNPYYQVPNQWHPNTALIYGETHSNASQMPGDIQTPVDFQQSGFYANNQWQVMNNGMGTGLPANDVSTIGVIADTPWYGDQPISSNELKIWDWSCPPNTSYPPYGGVARAASVSSTSSEVDNFYTTVAGGLYHTWNASTPYWETEIVGQPGQIYYGGPPGGVASNPAAVVNGTRMDVFVRDYSSQLWHAWGTSGSWRWEEVTNLAGGTIISDPSVVSYAPGDLEVFGRGTDGYLQHWVQNNYSGWGHEEFSSAAQVAGNPLAQNWPSNGWHVFYQGAGDHTLREVFWSSGQLEAWDQVPNNGANVYSDPAAVLWPNWEQVVFADAGQHLRSLACCTGGWTLTGWLASGVQGPISAFAWGSFSVDFFYKNTSGQLADEWCCSQQTGWTAFAPGSAITSAPSALAWGTSGRADAFARGTWSNGYNQHISDEYFSGGWAWTWISSAAPPSPKDTPWW